MLNLQVADLFATTRVDFSGMDAGLKTLQSRLKSVPSVVPIKLKVSVQGGFAQAIAGLKSVKSGLAAPVTIQVRADTRPFLRSVFRASQQARQLLPPNYNVAVTSNISGLIQSLNQVTARLQGINKLAQVKFPGGGSGGGARGGSRGPGFGAGLAQGLGLPLAFSPQMMAGELVGKGLAASVGTAIEFETEFARIRQITGASADQVDRLKSSLQQIAATQPGASMTSLIEAAQIGGRQGITDPDKLADFARGLARVSLVVKDMGVEDLANNITRVLHEFELGTEYVEGFGSALVAMDNASTASAKDILDITQRLGGTARAIGLTIPQVVALASVLKDVGLSNDAAGSSFSQIFRMMAADSEGFAKKIGVDATTFANAYRRDPMEALGMVIARFKEMKDTIEGQEFLADLGLKGVRTAGALQQLASQFDEVNKRAKVASAETGSQKSLGDAGAIMGDTTGAALGKLQNAALNLADALGQPLLGPIKDVSSALTGIAEMVRGHGSTVLTAAGGVVNPTGTLAGLGRGAADRAYRNLPTVGGKNWSFGLGNIRDLVMGRGSLAAAGMGGGGGAGGAGAPAGGPAALPAVNPNPPPPKAPEKSKEQQDYELKSLGIAAKHRLEEAIGPILGLRAMGRQFLAGTAGKAAGLLNAPEAAKHSASIVGGMDMINQQQIDILNGGAEVAKQQLAEQKTAGGVLREIRTDLRNFLGQARGVAKAYLPPE